MRWAWNGPPQLLRKPSSVEPLPPPVRVDLQPPVAALEDNPPQLVIRPAAKAHHVKAEAERTALPLARPRLLDLAPQDAVRLAGLLAPRFFTLDDGGDDRGNVFARPFLAGRVVELAAALPQSVQVMDELVASFVPNRSSASTTIHCTRPASANFIRRWKSGLRSASSRAQPSSLNQNGFEMLTPCRCSKARAAAYCRSVSCWSVLMRR